MADLRSTPCTHAASARGEGFRLEHRRPSIRFSDAPRGTCRWCGEEILHGPGPKQGRVDFRRRWHPECVDAYNASDPRELRRLVRKRDRGICCICRVDTNRVRREASGRGRARKLRELGFHPRRSLWELDHIVPLIDGGGHGADNLQTLCVPCHRQKTAEEARARAVLRREESPCQGVAERIDEAASTADTAPQAVGGPLPGEPRSRNRATQPVLRAELEELLARADAANARVEALLAGD